jgi:UDPglucose--hexose-1-phosphate uridylyltransferase
VSDLRKDPTRGRWVLVRPATSGSAPTDQCPFCQGNEDLTRPEIAAYRKEGSPADGPGWSVRVIPEVDPYFGVDDDLVREGVGLYDRVSPRGATELIVESPAHDDTPATMRQEQWEQVLWMYRERLFDLKGDRDIRDILVTRRHRSPGSRITHPYSRLTAIPIIFDDVRRKLRQCRDYYEYKRRCIYCDIVRQDMVDGSRLIRVTEHFVVLAPYAARSAFETWVLPRRHDCSYEDALSGDVVADLAALLREYFRTLAGSLGDPSFEMTLYTAPNVAAKILPGEWATIGDDYHWHLEVTLDPYRRARIGGIYVNETPPEDAARMLREAWVPVS